MVDVRAFRKTLRVFEQFISNQFYNCCCGVTVAQCHCLFAIEDLGQTTIGELADYLYLDKSTLSRTVESLVLLGFVNRQNNLYDRRSFLIHLSPSGRQQVEKMHLTNDAYFSQIFEYIPEADRESVAKYLQLFIDAIAEYEVSNEENCCN